MLHIIILIACCLCAIVNGKECETCHDAVKLPVCGSNGKTFPSFCELMKQECLQDKLIGFECDGKCPCDPVELKEMDERTVNKLADLRRDLQLENHIPEMELENDSDDIVTLEILDNDDITSFKGVEDQGTMQPPTPTVKEIKGCPRIERLNLPSRLIDWFHVLRANEQEKKNHEEGTLHEPVLREMNFMDGKLKAMYSKLACHDNSDDVEKEVCLPSVAWMFHNLDKDKNQILTPIELLEIEELNSEHCIKPFLRSCDKDNDQNVVLGEFCKCLCHTPPCTHLLENIPSVLMNGRARPYPGRFAPKCDQDGFFMPKQVNILKNRHWCVDRNGAEIDGSRRKTSREIHCGVNTQATGGSNRHIPMDMQRENDPTEK